MRCSGGPRGAGSVGGVGRRRQGRERTRAELLRAACATAAPPPPASPGLLPPFGAPLPLPPSAQLRRAATSRHATVTTAAAGPAARSPLARSLGLRVHRCRAARHRRGVLANHLLRQRNVAGGVTSRGWRGGGGKGGRGEDFWETFSRSRPPPLAAGCAHAPCVERRSTRRFGRCSHK